MSVKLPGLIGAIALLAFGLTLPAQAQDQWAWPEKPENLQVLPKDWPGTRLRPVMMGFSRALGVRCSHCHTGEEGQPLSTYDFASDENPNKERAREMLRMLGTVNDHLDKIEPSGDQRVNMWCHTCHRGRPRPMTLGEELGETYRMKGLDAALAAYADLRSTYYGKGAYNFGEDALNNFGYALLRNEDTAGAIQIFTLNAETFPESANVWDSLAEAYMKAGDTDQAVTHYQKSLDLDPNNDNAKAMLEKLKDGG